MCAGRYEIRGQREQRRPGQERQRYEIRDRRPASDRPAEELRAHRPVPETLLQGMPSFGDEVVTHMAATLVGCVVAREGRHEVGHAFLGGARGPCEPLDDLSVRIARLEIHPCIHVRRVGPQDGFDAVGLLEECFPVDDVEHA